MNQTFAPPHVMPASPVTLSNLERSVMQVAWIDSRAAPRSAVSRVLARLFGRAPQRLANPVLEALRRYCVMLLVGRPVAAEEWAALLAAANYTPARLRSIRASLMRGAR